VADGVVTVPPHAFPLIVQFTGSPVPFAVKPNVVLAPAASAPFQLSFATVYVWPLAVSVPFHSEVIVVPEGSEKTTFQLPMAELVVLVMVYVPVYPPSQPLALKDAAGTAALAPLARTMPPPATASVAPVPSAISLARREKRGVRSLPFLGVAEL
jgi:hypothetical protein